MFSVLLVDDEPTITESLKGSVHWEALGVQDIYIAMDGLEALDILAKTRIDLLITDIKMPRMDGFELLQNVKVSFPDMHCILLTAYSDFEYAREAIKLGVENYLLKPFNPAEVEETIEKALDNLYSHNFKNEAMFKDNVLTRWVMGTIGSNELSDRALMLHINIYQSHYMCICSVKHKSHISFHSLLALVAENPALKDLDIYSFWDMSDHFVSIIGGKTIDTDLIKEAYLDALKSLYNNLDKENSGIHFSFGNIVTGFDHLSESYHHATNLIDGFDSAELFVTDKVLTDHAMDVIENELKALFSETEETQKINKSENIIASLESINEDRQTICALLSGSVLRIFHHEFPNAPETEEKLLPRARLFCHSEEPLIEAQRDFLNYCYLIYQYCFNTLSPVIQLAVKYIHEHYSESLSIKEFCVKNKMNAAYFGFLFKKETGLFYNNYLMEVRITASYFLLTNTNMTLDEIASEIGFSTANYYISCFKKQTGLSPTKYRTMKLGGK